MTVFLLQDSVEEKLSNEKYHTQKTKVKKVLFR